MSDFSEVCCESSAEGTWKTDIGTMISTKNTGTIIPTSTMNSYPTKMGFENIITLESCNDVMVNGCNSDVCKENAKNLAVSADCGSTVGEALTNYANSTQQSSSERIEGQRCTCKCSSSEAVKRRVSTSDINFATCDAFTNPNTIPLKKNVLGSGRSLEKVDKINLANLVFNPNFKNSAGCVNLPVIRAGQNLAQKNAQRSALTFTKDPLKDLNNNLTEQDTIDLITKQLQPQSLDALASKIQQLSLQRKIKTGTSPNVAGANDAEDDGADGDIIQTFNGKSAAPSQSNALRYKTELCRSYEEGGECRFGSACTFAHGPEELRPVPRHPLYKTELCRTYHQHGYCQYGTRCHFIHDADEADKNAPLKGCKTWGRHDQLSSALLSMAASCGLLEGDSAAGDNDVLLANLRRLYALRMMNTQEKQQQQETNSQFSMSQPMSQQLSMAHQQLASASQQHLPLSMTQPLPMDAMQMSLQRAGQMPQRTSMVGHSRLESLANEYSSWGMVPPPSPTYSGISPFASYQQFSPLPHHQMAHHSYPHYAFSATAPDLSTALSMSPYGVSPQTFSNTVNVSQLLQDQNGNYQAASAGVLTQNGQQMQQPKSLAGGPASVSAMNPQQSHLSAMPNPMWPATSNEVSSAIDKELFGFGLDSHQAQHGGMYQQYQYPFFQQQQSQQQQQLSQQQQQQQVPKQAYYTGSVESSMKLNSQSSSNGHRSRSSAEVDLLSLINNDKYARRESGTLKTITEAEDVKHSQGVRPKTSKIKSCSNAGVIVDS